MKFFLLTFPKLLFQVKTDREAVEKIVLIDRRHKTNAKHNVN
jgi:hypothetical protein